MFVRNILPMCRVLVACGVLLCLPHVSLGHQQNASTSDNDQSASITVELLDPWGEDQTVTQTSADLESWHWLTLERPVGSAYTEIRGQLLGRLYYDDGSAFSDGVASISAYADDPGTPVDESVAVVGFGMGPLTRILVGGANTIKASSFVTVRGDGTVIAGTTKDDTHTITRVGSP